MLKKTFIAKEYGNVMLSGLICDSNDVFANYY